MPTDAKTTLSLEKTFHEIKMTKHYLMNIYASRARFYQHIFFIFFAGSFPLKNKKLCNHIKIAFFPSPQLSKSTFFLRKISAREKKLNSSFIYVFYLFRLRSRFFSEQYDKICNWLSFCVSPATPYA